MTLMDFEKKNAYQEKTLSEMSLIIIYIIVFIFISSTFTHLKAKTTVTR